MPVESSSSITSLDVSLSKYMMMARKELPCAAIIMFFPDSSSGTTCSHSITHRWGLGNRAISLTKVTSGECLEVKGSC